MSEETEKYHYTSTTNPLLEFPEKIRAASLEHIKIVSRCMKIKKSVEELEMLEMDSVTSIKGKDGKPIFSNAETRKAAVFQNLGQSRAYLETACLLEDYVCLEKKAQIELQYLRDMFTAHIAVGRVL